MITNWRVFNFKSIRRDTDLPLAPLTLFAGANSSGKSTFVQSLLLVAQTFANKVRSRTVVLNGALASLGQFDDLRSTGSDASHIAIGCTCQPLPASPGPRASPSSPRGNEPRFFYSPRDSPIRQVSCDLQFDANPSGPTPELLQTQPRLLASHLTCRVPRDEDDNDNDTPDHTHHITLRQTRDSSDSASRSSPLAPTASRQAAFGYDVDLDATSLKDVRNDSPSATPVGCLFRHFLPDRIVYRIEPLRDDAEAIASFLRFPWPARPTLSARRHWHRRHGIAHTEQAHLPDAVLEVLRRLLRAVSVDLNNLLAADPDSSTKERPTTVSFERWQRCLRAQPRDVRVTVVKALRATSDLPELILDAIAESSSSKTSAEFLALREPRQLLNAADYLDDYFALSLKYLGPLRDAPRPLYPVAPVADPYDVGLRGERTASVLELYKNTRVKYLPSSHFSEPTIERRPIVRKLETAVSDWLRYLDVAKSVDSKDRGRLGHELRVTLSGGDGKHDVTHVGVGVSQVLPILVMCLLAREDSVLVLEQPELHLHPKVQTLLGDFFLSIALCRKQCVVETHSEYLVDRLRFRIAAAKERTIADKTRVYFVEKAGAGSIFREVRINEYGAIPDWPEGFFDQSQRQAEAILQAAALKRRRRLRTQDH